MHKKCINREMKRYVLANIKIPIVINENGLFDINDYKTNKVINFYSQYAKKLLPPMDHLDDCQYNIYALQLSIYAYFYEQCPLSHLNDKVMLMSVY